MRGGIHTQLLRQAQVKLLFFSIRLFPRNQRFCQFFIAAQAVVFKADSLYTIGRHLLNQRVMAGKAVRSIQHGAAALCRAGCQVILHGRKGGQVGKRLHILHIFIKGGSVLSLTVQLPRQHVKLIAQRSKRIGRLRPSVIRSACAHRLYRSFKLRKHVFLVGFVGVQLQTKILQPDAFEALMHHLQGSGFLGHKEHSFAVPQTMGNHVGNGLALARAGGAYEHKVFTTSRGQHGRQLGGVAGHRRVYLIRLHIIIQPGGVGEPHLHGEGGALLCSNLAHNGIAQQKLLAVAQILPHQVFGEREYAQRASLHHLPSLHIADGSAHYVEDTRNIQPGVICRQVALQLRQAHGVLCFEQLQQGHVHARLLIRTPQHKAGFYRGAGKAHGQQQQGGQVRFIPHRAALAAPFEETAGNIEGVGTALLHLPAGGIVQVCQLLVQVLLGQVDSQLPLGKHGAHAIRQLCAHYLRVFTMLHLGGEVPECLRYGFDAEVKPLRQQILQGRYIGLQQRELIFTFNGRIKQGIAQGEVEQFKLPSFHTRARAGRYNLLLLAVHAVTALQRRPDNGLNTHLLPQAADIHGVKIIIVRQLLQLSNTHSTCMLKGLARHIFPTVDIGAFKHQQLALVQQVAHGRNRGTYRARQVFILQLHA